jgi:membrane protease YdiL (CAAX protease family)
MSIVIAATTQPADTAAALLILLPWLGVGLLVMGMSGVFRGRRILGPPRVAADERSVFFAILFLMTVGSGVMSTALLAQLPVDQHWKLILGTSAFYGVGALVMVLGNALLRERGLEKFGLTLRLLPRGLWQGALALFALLPVVYVVSAVVDWSARALEMPIPQHELLIKLTEGLTVTKAVLLIVVAVVGAPLFEELLFRGVMQTFLVRVLGGRQAEVGEAGVPMTAPVDDSPMSRIERAEATPQRASQRILARWMSIVITALIFAAVHGQPLWIPPLMALAIGMGYMYERTGNLWIPVVMHALFNGLQIVLFLTVPQPGT